MKTKSKKKFADIEVHTLEDGKWAWRPVLDYLVPVKSEKDKYNVHSIAKYIHHELYN